MPITKEEKIELIKKHGDHPKDTGKAEVQIAILSKEIDSLTKHLQASVKDHHSKRGLFMKVGKRKRLLSYLKKTNITRYRDLIAALGLRK